MCASGRRMRSDAKMIKAGALEPLVIIMRNADENSEVGSAFQIKDQPCVFDRLPRGLEEESMLRIHIGSFPRRDPKELGIELIDGIDKSATQGDRFTHHTGLRIVISVHVPAIGRHFNNAFPGFDKKFPES